MVQDSVYPRGAVRRISVTDFMGFVGTLVLDAGPRVNLVEGTNGSGKSSIVTALCVGLAGSMKSLQRQTRVEELVRRGSSAFEVEVSLSGGADQPDVIVHRRTELGGRGGDRGGKRRRVGDKVAAAPGGDEGADDDVSDEDEPAISGRGSCHTEWRIDGRVANEARVKELTRGMGIHFENLCQFLPQERVAAFSELGPTELLESTEEAIGEGRLLAQHKELKQRSVQLKAKREELQRVRDRLAKVEADQAANAAEYQRLQRRNALQQEVELLHSKVLWMKKEQCAGRLSKARESEATLQRKVDAARRRLAEAEAALSARTESTEAGQRATRNMLQAVKAKDRDIAAGREALRRQEEQLKTTSEEMEGLRAKSTRWANDLNRAIADLNHARAERAALPRGLSPEQAARMEQITQEVQHVTGKGDGIKLELARKREVVQQLDGQIRQFEEAARRRLDRREQLLRKLERSHRGSRQLYEWIMKTRGEGGFRRRVLGPLLMEISAVQDATWAMYLEKAVGASHLAMVVTEDKSDNNMVHDWLNAQKSQAGRAGRGAFMNKIYCLPGPHPSMTYPLGNPRQFAAYGITHTLDQVFEATSDLVKAALVNLCQINQTYIGNRETDTSEVMDRLLRETPIRRIFTPVRSTFAGQSQYDRNHMYQSISYLQPARLLADSVVDGDETAERAALGVLQEERNSALAEAGQLEVRVQACEAAERALREERLRLVAARKDIEQRTLELVRQETDCLRRQERLQGVGDPMATAGGLRDTLRNGAERILQQAKAFAGLLKDQQLQHRELAALQLADLAAVASLAPLKLAVRRGEEVMRTAADELEVACREVAQARGRLQEMEARLKDKLGPGGPSAQLQTAWAAFPDDVEALKQLLADKQAKREQAQGAIRGDEALVLEAWRRRETEMAELRQRAAAGSTDLASVEADVEAKMAAWLPELQQHIAAINDSVKHHFAAIDCAGEVVLREAGDEFDKYAAEIRVQYRPEEPLRPLNRNHHSGGERSVATMLYLMALQGVTTTPFRVVDEINQGMDSRNERKVFNLLVECSSRPDTPQCFLMTPKLIANLHFNDHVRVHSFKIMWAGGCDVPPGFVARLLAEAAEQEGAEANANGAGGSGGRNASGQQRRQQRSGGGSSMRLGEVPWQATKEILFFGRAAATDRPY